MKKAKKNKRKLDRRTAAWHNLIADGTVGRNTKMIRGLSGVSAHHKPGSQNGRH